MNTTLAGHDVVWISDGRLEVAVATQFGPRLLGLRLAGGHNVFAELGSAGIDRDTGDRYTFYGGHRLWVAPEVPEITYAPDDLPVTLEERGGQTTVRSDDGPFAKAISIAFDGEEVQVGHRLSNQTGTSAEAAVWAITQLRPGGTARLPLATTALDEHGLQPNRLVVAWPYTNWADPLVELDNDEIRLLAGRSTPTKVGTVIGGTGVLTYDLDGLRFSKRIEASPGGVHGDLGANGQIYANEQFVELETAGPLVTLGPGESATHTEWWALAPA